MRGLALPTPSLPQYAGPHLVELADRNVKTFDALNGHLSDGSLYRALRRDRRRPHELRASVPRPSSSTDGTPNLQCVPPPMSCSFVDKKCTTAVDCCDPRNDCINSRNVSPIVPK